MPTPRCFACDEEPLRDVDHVGLVQRLADGHAGRRKERVCDAAADHELIDLGNQVLEHGQLGRNLRAAHDRDQRPRGIVQCALKGIELAGKQRPGAGDRRTERNAMGARLRAMCGTECVHDEHVAERGHARRERFVVLLLALEEAHVLQQHDFAGRCRHAADPVLDEAHRPRQQLRQRVSRPARARARDRAPPPSAARDATSPARGRVVRSPCGASAAPRGSARRSVTTPFAIGTLKSSRISTRRSARSRSVIRIAFIGLFQPARDQASVVSSMRFENPHSLSYQAQTLTSVPPSTFVSCASTVPEAGL